VRGLQRDAYLLRRVLVDDLSVLADGARVRGSAFLQRGQAGPDVPLVEKAVSLDPHAGEPRLEHLQPHLTRADVLLWNAHAHRVVAAAGVGVLQRLERALDVAEIAALAGERREDAVDLRLL